MLWGERETKRGKKRTTRTRPGSRARKSLALAIFCSFFFLLLGDPALRNTFLFRPWDEKRLRRNDLEPTFLLLRVDVSIPTKQYKGTDELKPLNDQPPSALLLFSFTLH